MLIEDEKKPRGCWKIGRVAKIIEGKENQIRSATVQLPNVKALTRPTNFLPLLEVSSEYKEEKDEAEKEKVKEKDEEVEVKFQQKRGEDKREVRNLRNRQPKTVTEINEKSSGMK